MHESKVDIASAEKKAAKKNTSSKGPYGADALAAAIGACTEKAQVVIVILEPDADGTMDYIVEYAGESARKGVPWWHVLGLLNAGIAKTSFDMFAPLDADPYAEGTGYEAGDEQDPGDENDDEEAADEPDVADEPDAADEDDEEEDLMDDKHLDDEPGE